MPPALPVAGAARARRATYVADYVHVAARARRARGRGRLTDGAGRHRHGQHHHRHRPQLPARRPRPADAKLGYGGVSRCSRSRPQLVALLPAGPGARSAAGPAGRLAVDGQTRRLAVAGQAAGRVADAGARPDDRSLLTEGYCCAGSATVPFGVGVGRGLGRLEGGVVGPADLVRVERGRRVVLVPLGGPAALAHTYAAPTPTAAPTSGEARAACEPRRLPACGRAPCWPASAASSRSSCSALTAFLVDFLARLLPACRTLSVAAATSGLSVATALSQPLDAASLALTGGRLDPVAGGVDLRARRSRWSPARRARPRA